MSIPIVGAVPHKVTSYAEVWIEIFVIDVWCDENIVTSYAEVWIEIA